MGDNIFYVTKGKSKDYNTLLIREKAKPPNITQKLHTNFHFNRDHPKLPHSSLSSRILKPSGTNQLTQFFTQIQRCIKQVLEQMIYVLCATISPNH